MTLSNFFHQTMPMPESGDSTFTTATYTGDPMEMETAITFDDVNIRPRYSDLDSRDEVKLQTRLSKNITMDIPLVAAPMDTVCESNMTIALRRAGGIGVLHRFCTPEQQFAMVEKVFAYCITQLVPKIVVAIGSNGDSVERATRLIQSKRVRGLVIDVAHGHHNNVRKLIESIGPIAREYKVDIIGGSIATEEAAEDLIKWGCDGLRVGVGGGSVCETRIRTGIGIPQLSAIMDVCNVARDHDIPVIADGGIRYPGDAAKALAAGASSVMIGSLFSGTDEAPGDEFVAGVWPNTKRMKIYRGLASETTKLKHAGQPLYVEGASKMVECKGSVRGIIEDLCEGIRSSMSYVGTRTIREFQDNAEFVFMTGAGAKEARPHLLD